MIRFTHRGSFNNIEKFLNRMTGQEYMNILDTCGQMGVEALRAATPVESGKTASSWTYEIVRGGGMTEIHWLNTNENKGVNIALILQYGHGTGTGGYVQGRDYINPAMQPVFDKIAEEVWRVVTSS